jgi:exonuclease SbcC
MAAELARALTEGDPCPVCGGLEHPSPATVSDPVLPGDIVDAEHRLAAAETQLRSFEAEIESLRTRAGTRLAGLEGADRETLELAVSEAAAALTAARADAHALAEVAARLRLVSGTAEAHRTSVAGTVARLEAVAAALDDLAAAEAGATDRVEALRADHGDCPCGSPDPAEHVRAARALTDLAAAVAELGGADGRLASVTADLDAALGAAGVDDADSARAALLAPADLARLRAAVTAQVEDTAAARAVAEDPDVVAALAADPPDLPALQAVDRAAREALLSAAAAQDDAARALRSLERLLPLVDEACARVALGAERDARVRELADTTSGIGPDNTLRMRLTAYVLAARLETVATLANERLAVMGGGRYLLEHSDERAARGARSGLGLRVLDQWTGRVRDTATLSGGESFMASLALALGLADAVREEVGGLDLGTLFIDEGFGSLDDDSLEQVLTVLDGLREGGRAVGVVSHVADLRTRITHQAVVHKGPNGSTVEVRVGRAAAEPAA